MDKSVNATTLEVHDFGCVKHMVLPSMWMAPPSFKNDFAPFGRKNTADESKSFA